MEIDWYQRSEDEFIRKLRENPRMTRDEWEEYAHANYFFSSFTLAAHILTEWEWEEISKKNIGFYKPMVNKLIPIVLKKERRKWFFNGKFITRN